MRLRLFHAPSMAEAMAMVRTELGEDAVILGSRRVAGGIEITAALEPADPILIPPVPAAGFRPVQAVAAERAARLALLTRHNMPGDMADQLADGALAERLAAMLRFGALPIALTGAVPLEYKSVQTAPARCCRLARGFFRRAFPAYRPGSRAPFDGAWCRRRAATRLPV